MSAPFTPPSEELTPDLAELNRPLTNRERRKWLTGPVISSPFDSYESLFPSFETTGVYDRGQEDARDLKQMLKRDGRARQLENVLTLPERAAVPEIRPKKDAGAAGKRAAELVEENVGPWMRRLHGQGTSSSIFRKAFFEAEWEVSEGETRYKSIEYRPPATCQARFDPRSGKPAGFRQQVVTPDGRLVIGPWDETPGWKIIPQPRAIILTHGTHREPIQGTSELDVVYWAWENRMKVLFLLFQFLESQSLPKIVAYGPDAKTAQANADYLAEAKAAGVIPFIRQSMGTGSEKFFDLLESSGQGSAQFLECVRYLEEQQIQSVLAGFMQLTGEGKSGGSFALSHDAREFFLQSRQAVADERAEQWREQAFRPLVAYNLGDPDLAPELAVGPLSTVEIDRGLEMLKTLSVATTVNTPWEFLDDLTIATAKHIGLDPAAVERAVRKHAKEREEKEAMAEAIAAAGMAPVDPATGEPMDPAAPGAEGVAEDQAAGAAAVGSSIESAFELVRRVDFGQDPIDAVRAMAPETPRGPNPGGHVPIPA